MASTKSDHDAKSGGSCPDEREEFLCQMCGLKEKYDYFGRKPKFAPNYVFLEDVYLAVDPFSSQMVQKSFLLLGSNCSICGKTVCQNQGCSLFFAKWICLKCAESNLLHFPNEIQQEVVKRSQ